MRLGGHRRAGLVCFLAAGACATSALAQPAPARPLPSATPAAVASAPAVAAPPAPARPRAVAPAPAPRLLPVPSASVAPSALPLPSAPAVEPEPAPPLEVAPPPPEPPPSASASAPPPAEPLPPPAPSASAALPKLAEASAKIHDTVVFTLRVDQGGKTAAQRARAATEALTRAVEGQGTEEVRVALQGGASVVYAGPVPVVELYQEDADAAGASSRDSHAAAVASRVREVIRAEKRRSAIAGTVFSFSLLVFFGLVAFYVLQKVGEFFHGVRKWMLDNPDRITGLRVQKHEVIGPTALRGGLLVALILGRFVAQLGVVYVWLVFALSLFQTTRPYTAKLTGFVVTPLSELAGRVAASLPVAVVAVVSGVALYILLRFVQLFFEGVAHRQTTLPWLPPDLAAPTSVLIRIGVVVTALVFAAPIVTGDAEGPLSRTGMIAVLAFGIASTPLLASFLVGAIVVYGRRVRVDQHVEIGGKAGRVAEVGLLDVRLIDVDGADVRVPHLFALVHPTRTVDRFRVVVEIPISGSATPRDAQRVLTEAAAALGDRAVVELVDADAQCLRFRIAVSPRGRAGPSDVRLALLDAAADAGFTLGRPRGGDGRP